MLFKPTTREQREKDLTELLLVIRRTGGHLESWAVNFLASRGL